MLAVRDTYYKQARIREGDVFEVETEHVRFFENRGEARQLPLTEDAIAADTLAPIDTENALPIVKRRGRPPKNKVMIPSSGGEYQTK